MTEPAFRTPYEYFAHLRNTAPVAQAEEGGPYQVVRHADVHALLKDNKTFSSDVSMRPPEERNGPSMLFSDPPIHNRLRKLVSYAFKPGHIEAQRALIAERCDELVNKMESREDLVPSLASPLPVMVIAHMLGVVDGDFKQFKYWSDKIFSNIGDILFAEPTEDVQKAAAEMDAYFLGLISEMRTDPPNNLLGRLIETETEDGKLSDEELLSFCRLLLIAGNETTTGLITASVRIFDEFPETLNQIHENPALVPTFIEEALRFHSPFSATVRRTTCDASLADTVIPKGSLVLPLMSSANRDETVFDNPEQFVIDRSPNPHLAFGFGIHFCLGAHLARLEGEIAVKALARRFSKISIAADANFEAAQLGGPSALPVELTLR